MDFSSEPGMEAREGIERHARQHRQGKAWVRSLTGLKGMIERLYEADNPPLRGGAHRRRPGPPAGTGGRGDER